MRGFGGTWPWLASSPIHGPRLPLGCRSARGDDQTWTRDLGGPRWRPEAGWRSWRRCWMTDAGPVVGPRAGPAMRPSGALAVRVSQVGSRCALWAALAAASGKVDRRQPGPPGGAAAAAAHPPASPAATVVDLASQEKRAAVPRKARAPYG